MDVSRGRYRGGRPHAGGDGALAPVPGMRRRSAATPAGTPTVLAAARTAIPASDPSARRSALLIVLGVATVVARMHEFYPPLRVIRPILIVVLLIGMATVAARRRLRISATVFSDPSLLVLYGYWAWMFVTVPTSIYRSNSVKVALDMTLVMVFATMLALQPPTLAQVRTITRGFFTVTAVFGVALLLFGYAMMDVDGLRYAITASLDPNDCAGFLAIGAPMALAEARRKGKASWRAFSWTCFIVICLAVLRTASRGGLIALVVGVMMVLLSTRGPRMMVTFAGLALLMGVGRFVIPEGMLPKRLTAMTDLSDDYNFTLYGGRIQVWTRGVKYFTEDPVLGVGVGNFSIREGQQMAEDGVRGHWSAPHNAYIQSFSELGLAGGLLFCSAIGVSLWRVFPIFRRVSPITGTSHPEYLAAVLAFSASAIFLSHAYFWGFFALVGLCSLAAQVLVPQRTASR